MARIIVIVSGKGGVGKTTVTANLGLMLALDGYKVVLADADVGLNNLDVALGLDDRVVYDIVDVADGKANLNQALVKSPYLDNLRLIQSAKAYSSKRVSTEFYSGIIGEASLMSDYVLVDAPAGVESGFHRAVCAAREALVVTTPHVSAIKDADRTARLLGTYNVSGIGLVVNRVRGDLVNKGMQLSPETVSELMRLPLVGVIPESDKVNIDSVATERRDSAFVAFHMLSGRVAGDSEDVYNACRGYGRLSKFFKR